MTDRSNARSMWVAQRTTVMLVDDLDGSEADESLEFGLDGVTYEIDLTSTHAAALRDELAAYGFVRPKLGRVPLAALGVGAGLAANIGTTGPMAALGITDPRTWPADSWVSDLVPHLAYGFATATVWDLMQPRRRRPL